MKSGSTFIAMLKCVALAGALLMTAATADAQTRRRPAAITVTPPEKFPGVDWNDSIRWHQPTPAEVRALSRYTRQCTDWYQLEHRPSGTVLTPQMRCRWVRR